MMNCVDATGCATLRHVQLARHLSGLFTADPEASPVLLAGSLARGQVEPGSGVTRPRSGTRAAQGGPITATASVQ